MLKSKIFFGLNQENNSADYKLNKWLAENPNVEIIEFNDDPEQFIKNNH